jgi:hypothetical protein
MNEEQSKLGVIFAIATFAIIIAFLVVSFIGIVDKENCWDNYKTEQQAIINCEGVNK